MAVTPAFTVTQEGKHFTVNGELVSGAAASDAANLVVQLSDLTLTRGPRQSDYTAFKVLRLVAVGSASHATLDQRWELEWDAATNDYILDLPQAGAMDVDFRSAPQGALINPRSTTWTGALNVNYTTGTGAADIMSLYIEGELVP
jgi:hypothetical protein